METVAPPPRAAAPTNPYKGLVPYTEEDAEFFFGRDRDRDILIANLSARRLTVVYGESGVGKSSLLRAGVEAKLRRDALRAKARFGSPEFLPVVLSAWRNDPVAALIAAIHAAVRELADVELERTDGLAEVIEEATERTGATLVLILDQFEDYNLYHPHEDGSGTFAFEFPAVVRRTDLALRFLVSVRIDALAQLDRFKRSLPGLWDKRLRIRPLTRASAQEAITGPLDKYNEQLAPGQPPIEIEPELVAEVLDQVQLGRVLLEAEGKGSLDGESSHHGNGHGGVNGHPPADAIEAPYLQLVMTRLWETELAAGSHVLRASTLRELGGAERIVKTHLDNALGELPVAERDAAADLFHYLVTPSGTKIAHEVETLAEWSGHSPDEVRALIAKLQGEKRIIRPVPPPPDRDDEPSYEIYHDVLAAAILDWRTRYNADRLEREKRAAEERARVEQARAQAERQRALRFRFAMRSALAVIALGVIGLAIYFWRTAVADSNTAKSRQLAASAADNLGRDPELSALVAMQALKVSDTSQAESALRAALPQVQTVRTLRPGAIVLSAAFDPVDKNTIASAGKDGVASLWDVRAGTRRYALAPPQTHDTADAVAFSPDGRQLAVGYGSGDVTVFDTRTGARVRSISVGPTVNGLAFLGSTSFVAAATADGTMIVDTSSTAKTCNQNACIPVAQSMANSVAVNPHNGLQFALTDTDGTSLWNFDPRALKSTHRNLGRGDQDATFSSDGTQVVSADEDGKVRVWDTASGKQLMSLDAGQGVAQSATLSPDGKYVVAGYASGAVQVWDTSSQLPLRTLRGHTSRVVVARFAADGTEIVTAGDDGTVRVWHTQPPELRVAFSSGLPGGTQPARVYSAQYSPTGDRIVTVDSSGNAYLFHADGSRVLDPYGQPVILNPGRNTTPTTARFNRAGTEIVTADQDGTVRLWQANGSNYAEIPLATPIKVGPGAALDAEFSPDGSKLVVVTSNSTAEIRNTQTGARERTLNPGSSFALDEATFSPDGGQVFTGDSDGQVEVWDAATGHELAPLGRYLSAAVNDIEFDPTGDEFVTASQDGTVIVRRWPGDAQKLSINACASPSSAALSPDGSKLVVACSDGSAPVFDVTSGQLLTTLRAGNFGSLNSVTFSPDGASILTSFEQSGTGGVRVWNAELATRSLATLEAIARQRVTRTLTPEERKSYLVGVSG